MSCLICAGPAESFETHGNWEERNCPSCGRYKISSVLILTLMEQGQIFDVVRMRVWLANQRSSTAVPLVEMHEARLAI